ncbi:hypothetical protein HZA97_00265 [Candidatus Woesearchaeota archaeon]|nr:hypothetical protein [Candidatus Woesearchaeota archaeon]
MKCSICGSETHSSINCLSEVQDTQEVAPQELPIPTDTTSEKDPLFGDLPKIPVSVICRFCGNKIAYRKCDIKKNTKLFIDEFKNNKTIYSIIDKIYTNNINQN